MIDFCVESLRERTAEFGVELTDEICKNLNIYGNMLLETNKQVNLTAITEPNEVLYKHFYDCILFFKNVKVQKGAGIIDVGTGAGFPGMVLKIVRPDIEVTLLDGLNKRLLFLDNVINALGLKGIKTVHLRAEEGGKNEAYREKFDIACARAVAPLPVLAEFCAPYVKTGGIFVAMKGPAANDELESAKQAFDKLGLDKGNIICEKLREDEQRSFVISKKISQTPPKYPRNFGKISKQPL